MLNSSKRNCFLIFRIINGFDNYQNQNKIFKTLYLTEGVKRNHLEEEFLHFDDAQASKSLIH